MAIVRIIKYLSISLGFLGSILFCSEWGQYLSNELGSSRDNRFISCHAPREYCIAWMDLSTDTKHLNGICNSDKSSMYGY